VAIGITIGEAPIPVHLLVVTILGAILPRGGVFPPLVLLIESFYLLERQGLTAVQISLENVKAVEAMGDGGHSLGMGWDGMGWDGRWEGKGDVWEIVTLKIDGGGELRASQAFWRGSAVLTILSPPESSRPSRTCNGPFETASLPQTTFSIW
jgi:hypothetical protein